MWELSLMILTNLAVVARCCRKTVLGVLRVRKQYDFWQLALSCALVVIMFFRSQTAEYAFPLQRNDGKLRMFSHSPRLSVGFGDLGKRKISCPCRMWNHSSSRSIRSLGSMKYMDCKMKIYLLLIYNLVMLFLNCVKIGRNAQKCCSHTTEPTTTIYFNWLF
jgi:hypothetical protein